MTNIISLGCRVAEVHHQFASIHGNLFGAGSFRMAIAVLTGRSGKAYTEYVETLKQIKGQLTRLAAEVPAADAATLPNQSTQLKSALSEYITALETVITRLQAICAQLLEDEAAYRHTPPNEHSGFNRDKTLYDQELLNLERLGGRLNRLFSGY